jgi:hypothetical protein
VHLLTPKIQKAVTEPNFLSVVTVAVHFQRELFGRPQHLAVLDPEFNFASR